MYMTHNYVSRTLIANRGRSDERTITEAEIGSIDAPVAILGDAGSGKTELTKMLERQLGYLRITGGAFYRNQNIASFGLFPNTTLIIDGLDEIASSSGVSATDEILKKLSQIGNPKFLLSCRSADWQGSTDRHKIREDYGAEPVTLHLQPFTYENAKAFLDSYDGDIDANDVLDALDKHDLSEFYVNPLTLTLVAEIAAARQGLPKGRVELLNRASELLTSEQNPAHQRSAAAQSSLDALLDSAGAAFSHLLLSGCIGLSDRPREQTPDGYVPIGQLSGIAGAPLISAAIKTRLFQSPEENVYIPFHRVIAEYLGARWLSKRISYGLSERRAFQTLTFAGGVPTAFRGIHAWLAHFSPRLAPRCIQADPYGVLRYGDTDRLPLDQARLLLTSLTSLANEDSYFRSEDWGRRAISGLARPELKDEVVALIKTPERHVHLSTLILEALGGSALTREIAHELLAIVKNPTAAYVERNHAAEALIGSKVNIDWPALAAGLQTRKGTGDKQLTLEIIALTCGQRFSGGQIADAILAYCKPSRGAPAEEDSDDEVYVSGMVYGIKRTITPQKCGEILDEIASRIKQQKKASHWRPGYELSYTVHELTDKAIEDNEIPTAERAWSWLTLTEGERSYSLDRRQPIYDWLMQNSNLRREVQKIAFASNGDGGAWAAIVHDLPAANPALAISVFGAAEFLTEVGSKDILENFDVELWAALVQSQQSSDGVAEEIQAAADIGIQRHSALEQQWRKLITPAKRDWRKEEKKRREDYQQKRAQKFAKHRANFMPIKKKIASGEEIGALKQFAHAYLGRYNDLDEEAQPDGRVREWLGNELAGAALEGFVRALSRNDMPSAQQIAETHAEGKEWNVEAILVSGIAELVRSGRNLNSISRPILASGLAAWWEFPGFNSGHLGEHIQERLEDVVFCSEQETEAFLRTVIEPRIRAGHQHVPTLYRLAREARFRSLAGKLALKWLRAYPDANSAVLLELFQIGVEHAQPRDMQALVRERLTDLQNAEAAVQRMWMSAAVLFDFDRSSEALTKFFCQNRDYLWSLREMVRPERHERRAIKQISIGQLEFIIVTFANEWPPVPHPSGSSWGDTHPWNATEFIGWCIDAIGADPSEEASMSLERIALLFAARAYRDQTNHARAQQLRLRRDTEFVVPTFSEVKQTLSNGLPAGIDDLKAVVMDGLETVQDYVRNGDTNAWESFWNQDGPKRENTCRDRLLDQLRPGLPSQINFLPEITMPEANRADIVAVYHEFGLPIEIKGQWHTDVWNAADVQLIEKYARDWRADHRGIYLVLWFGHAPGKNLRKHPDLLPHPTSPEQLHDMLATRLPPAERTRIDIFVLDVSRPLKSHAILR
jgi:hypothetical protein